MIKRMSAKAKRLVSDEAGPPSKTPAFRLRKKWYHLTYPTHLDFEQLKKLLVSKGDVHFYSMVWENGKEKEESNDCADVRSYAHTHVMVGYRKNLDLRGPRTFDLLEQHPNIKEVETLAHCVRTFEYHQKDPVLIEQSEARPQMPLQNMMAVVAASNLVEAANLMNIEPKTIGDLVHLRNQTKTRQLLPSLDEKCHFSYSLDSPWRVLWMTGPTGIGKTQWAIAQFECPLLVRHMDTLKEYIPTLHDGLIFDDLAFAHWPREACIHLVDWDCPSSINVKHSAVTIPARTRRIFLSNLAWEMYWPIDTSGAIRRRVKVIVFPPFSPPLYSKKLVSEDPPSVSRSNASTPTMSQEGSLEEVELPPTPSLSMTSMELNTWSQMVDECESIDPTGWASKCDDV